MLPSPVLWQYEYVEGFVGFFLGFLFLAVPSGSSELSGQEIHAQLRLLILRGCPPLVEAKTCRSPKRLLFPADALSEMVHSYQPHDPLPTQGREGNASSSIFSVGASGDWVSLVSFNFSDICGAASTDEGLPLSGLRHRP